MVERTISENVNSVTGEHINTAIFLDVFMLNTLFTRLAFPL